MNKRMKNVMRIILVACTTSLSALSGCSTIQEPHQFEEIKSWVAINTLPAPQLNDIKTSFKTSLFDRAAFNFSYVSDYSDDESGDAQWAECQAYLIIADKVADGIFARKEFDFESVHSTVDYFVDMIYSQHSNVYNALIQSNYHPKAASQLAQDIISNPAILRSNLYMLFSLVPMKQLDDLLAEQVQIIDWDYVMDSSGDTYDAYSVIYQVGNMYAGVNFIIQDSGRYHCEIAIKSTSLLDIEKSRE